MTDNTAARPRTQAEVIYREARGAHEAAVRLIPLLSLLEEPEASASVEEITALLSTIVQILGQHSKALVELTTILRTRG